MPFIGGDAIVKERFKKSYRHPLLDERLTSRRVTQEARCLLRCKKAGIDTPTLLMLDVENALIYMEYIDGPSLRDHLNELLRSHGDYNDIATGLGSILASMHDLDIIHGDLTTSNILVRRSSQSLVLIDFGLGYVSGMTEDKAVDLYVLERAFLSTHPNTEKLFQGVLDAYGKNSKDSKATLKKLEEVRRRGRKRSQIG
ncbi:kinase-like domain-containing protein [Polychytrium aggregatum]|uniref:kinase-like domain-containing protein n=1 Tax=Polychytrium aggregatum TaxID=110093 RepID=UPI0022FF091A|nr:kinase-like domain-containing protein [Polychytrium aggregatum]KAI9207549.1 kinase-like domain-containing protein [Polychytrium aggregatum]